MTFTAGTTNEEHPAPRLARSSVIAVAVNIGGSAVRLLLQIVLARHLGATGYGRFVLGRSWGELLAKFPNLGYEWTAVKELPGYDRPGQHGLFRGYVRTAWRVTIVGAIGLALLSLAVYTVIVERPDSAIQLGVLLTAPLALAWLARGLLQGHHRFVTGSALIELLQPVAFALAVVALWIADRLTVVTSLVAWIATMSLAALAGQVLLRAGYSPELNRATPEFDRPRWRRTRRPLYVSYLAFVVLDNAGVLVVGALLERADVATFAVASRIAVLGTVIIAGVQSVASSHLAEAAATSNWAETQHIVDRSLRVCAIPSVLITIGAAVLAEPLVAMFGDDYGGAVTILRILLIGNLVNSITGPSGYVVSMSGLERSYARVMWSAAIATLVLVVVGTLIFGAAGAAWAVTAVTIAWNLALVLLAKRRLDVRCWVRAATFKAA